MYEIHWGDMTLDTFLKDYWQQKPLLIRQAFPDLEPVISADELAGLSLEEEVESRLIQFDPSKTLYKLTRGPLDPSLFESLPEKNWTLLVQALDHYSPNANALLKAFNFIPNWRVDDLMVSYATPGGGVGPHYDNYDVFLIQAEGTRHWQIGADEDSLSPRLPDAPVMILSDFKEQRHFDLEAGDMLYLPPRVSHNGIATSEDCITYSVGFRAPSDAELIRALSDHIGERLTPEQRFSDANRAQTSNPGAIEASSIDAIQERLHTLINDRSALESCLGSLVSEPKYPDLIESPNEDDFDDWFENACEEGFEIAPNTRLLYIDIGRFQLFCNAEPLNVEPCDEHFAKQLANQGYCDADTVNPENRSIISVLYLMGALI